LPSHRCPAVCDTGHREESALNKFQLKLYITGTNARTERAVANLRHICETELDGRYELEIIDVLENPEAAERDRVLATPTLIKELPPPLRRVIGDLSDRDKVILALEVRAAPGPLAAPPPQPPS
jgi:circadian clock protein KaiB